MRRRLSPTIVTTGRPLMGTCTYYYIIHYGHIYYIHAGEHNVQRLMLLLLVLLYGKVTTTTMIFFLWG